MEAPKKNMAGTRWECEALNIEINHRRSIPLYSRSTTNSVSDHVLLLQRCGKARDLQWGRKIHTYAVMAGCHTDKYLTAALITMYSKCGCMTSARKVFDTTYSRDVFIWNCLLLGYVDNGQSLTTVQLFATMDCQPTSVTFVAVLKACGCLAQERPSDREFYRQKVESFHRQLRCYGFDTHIVVANTLLDTYNKCGSMFHARTVFDRIPHRTVVSWTSLIHGYVENGECLVAMEMFARMDCEPNHITFVSVVKACRILARDMETERTVWLERGRNIHRQLTRLGFGSNVVLASTLLDMYAKCGSMADARDVFEKMIRKDVVTWNSLILGHVENGETSVALDWYMSMPFVPDSVTFVAALKACRALADLPLGQVIHARVCKQGLEHDQTVANGLVDFYGRCGRLDVAEHVFDGIPSPCVVSWTSLMTGYSTIGNAPQAFHVANKMEEAGFKLNGITITCILTACARSGMVDQGKMIFESLRPRFGISPSLEHYTCIVDMLGRANRLSEASSLVSLMPFKADEVVWTSLLEAGRKWNAPEVTKAAFDVLNGIRSELVSRTER